jgi:hypothetical protein
MPGKWRKARGEAEDPRHNARARARNPLRLEILTHCLARAIVAMGEAQICEDLYTGLRGPIVA